MMHRTAEIQMMLIQFHSSLTASFTPNKNIQSWTTQSVGREMGVLKWVVMGKAYSEIAAIHAISVRTVKFHMSNIVNKLQVCNAKQSGLQGGEPGNSLSLVMLTRADLPGRVGS